VRGDELAELRVLAGELGAALAQAVEALLDRLAAGALQFEQVLQLEDAVRLHRRSAFPRGTRSTRDSLLSDAHLSYFGWIVVDVGATRISLCGRLSVELEGRKVDLPGRQGRLLMAYLVLHRDRPVRRDELVEALWPDGDAPGAGEALAPPLSRLRKALGAGVLDGRGELTLVLPEDAWVDWEVAQDAMQRAAAALGASDWRAAWGPAQAALAIADRGLLPGLEAPWIDDRRAELADLRVQALEAVATIGAQLRGTELAPAERAARAAVEAAPFRESARAALMEVLAAGGNVAEALRAYEDLRTLLRDELGTTPGAALVALHERLLKSDTGAPPAGDPAAGSSSEPGSGATGSASPGATGAASPGATGAASPGATGAASPGATGAPSAARTSAAHLVERDREVAALSSLVSEALEGEGRVVLVEGPAGIGKTRLLAEARRQASAAGALTLFARAGELERDFPFGVVRQLFEAAVADPAVRDRALAGAAAGAAQVFGAPDSGDEGEDASFAVLHGLFWLALNLAAQQPLLLAIDDLQWCDPPSLRFVAYLVRRLEGQPILVAATVRSAEPPTDAALLAEITNDPATASVRPSPLTEAGTRELVRARLSPDADDAFCASCHEATGGNPLLLRQLLTALESDRVSPVAMHARVVRETGPKAVAGPVLRRLSKLPREAVAVARGVAILGEAADLGAVAKLAELDEWQVAHATGALVAAEILRPEPPLGFVHPLVRDAVYHDLSPGERELQHARAAEVLTTAGASADQVASQLLMSPRRGDARVAAVLRDAASSAMRRGAPESAVAYLRRALEEPAPPEVQPELRLELGTAAVQGRAPDALEHLQAAYDTLPDPRTRARAARLLARTLIFTGGAPQAVAISRRAVAELPEGHDDLRLMIETMEIVGVMFGGGDPARLADLADYPIPARDAPLGAKMLAAIAALVQTYGGAPAEHCRALARAALSGDDLIEEDNGLLTISANNVLTLTEDPGETAAWARAIEDGERRGSLFIVSGNRMWGGFVARLRGDLVESEDLLLRAREEFVEYQYGGPALTYCAAFLGDTRLARGDLVGAAEALTHAGDIGDGSDGVRFWLVSRLAVLVAQGRYEEALAAADDLFERYPGVANPAVGAWRSSRAAALHGLGRTDEALAVVSEEVELARAFGAPRPVGHALRVLGEISGSVDTLREAVDVLTGSLARFDHAVALHAYGRAASDPASLRRAFEVAAACGAGGLMRDAAAALTAAGEEAPSLTTNTDALTAAERRVVMLAAEGRTARDIAQALFLTPRTVEVELESASRKLGVDSPDKLADALRAA
jgi:DNA-binding SARP family transcriptional activator/tetratricopeptide (TPR) repeat protein